MIKTLLPAATTLAILSGCTSLDVLVNELSGNTCTRVDQPQVTAFNEDDELWYTFQGTTPEEREWVATWRHRYYVEGQPDTHYRRSPYTDVRVRFDVPCRRWE